MRIEQVRQPVDWDNGDRLLALIIREPDRVGPGIHFYTDPTMPQQVAYMKHERGKKIEAHVHSAIPRQISNTMEVLIIQKGILKVDFYGSDGKHVASHYLLPGAICILIEGGHGFTVLEDLEAIEVKQGPYAGEKDKIRFNK